MQKLCVLLLSAAILSAQTAGRLTGKAEDSSGASVSNATVNLALPESTAAAYSTNTSEDGYFGFIGIRPGSYDLTINAPGFQRHVLKSVKVDPGAELPLPSIRLEVSTVVETVEVSSLSAPVQTANAEVSTTVTSRQLADLPSLDRQMIRFIQIVPGVSTGRGTTTINGLRTTAVNVTIDGINVQDNLFRRNGLDFAPNRQTVDQVAEFTVTSSNQNATIGGGSAQVTMVTPSGSNELHGKLLWNNRNSAFSANTFFNNRRGIGNPFLNQNQYGGYLGGAIIKNKLLYYGGYEKLDARQSTSVNRRILTGDARQGFFTYRPAGSTEVRKVNVLQAMGISIDPAISQLLQLVPSPEKINNVDLGDSLPGLVRNTAGYAFVMRNNRTRDNYTGKVDYIVSTQHAFTGTYLWNNEFVDRPDVLNDSTVEFNSYDFIPKAYTDANRNLFSTAWRWNPSPRFTNEARAGFNLAPTAFAGGESNQKRQLTSPLFSNPETNFQREGRDTYSFHYMDTASYVTGKHNFQFGFNLQQLRIRTYNYFNIVPIYRLGIGSGNPGLSPDQLPGITASDFTQANQMLATLGGYIDRVQQDFNVTSRDSGFVADAPNVKKMRFLNYAFFLQDTWKVRPRLSLTLGLRWEPFLPVDEADGLFLMPVLQNNNPVQTVLSNAVSDFAGGGTGRKFYQADYNNLAPNIGLAWDVFGDGKTSLRAGYMLSYYNDNAVATIRNNLTGNAGLNTSVIRNGTTASIRTGLPVIPAPAFKVPTTAAERYALDRENTVTMPDPGLVAPYTQNWTLGIQREFWGNVVELRYVGNKQTKMWRGIDYNQIDYKAHGFYEDFLRAYSNGNLARAATGSFNPVYNPAIAGSQPLAVFSQMPAAGNLTNATYRGLIERGEVANLAHQYMVDGRNGDFSFYRNPFALGTNIIQNFSNATYNSLQVEVNRRLSSGVQLNVNYVFSKLLSDSATPTNEQFEALLDNANPGLEKSRSPFDLRHQFKLSGLWQLPFGPGRKWNYSPLRHVIGGWTVGSFVTLQSGSPFSIVSARGTTNRGTRANQNTAITLLNGEELKDIVKYRMTGDGPMMVPLSVKNPVDGRAVAPDGAAPFAGQIFFHPGPGEIGTLGRNVFSGPSVFNLDASISKRVSIREGHSLELRMEAFNATNKPTFIVNGDYTLSSTTFGRVTTLFNDRRILQFGLQYQF